MNFKIAITPFANRAAITTAELVAILLVVRTGWRRPYRCGHPYPGPRGYRHALLCGRRVPGVFSLNVPVPGAVHRQAAAVRPVLGRAARDDLTLVAKRLSGPRRPVVEKRVRETVADTTPFPCRTTHVETFRSPTTGAGTVVYLAIDSPGLETLHRRLCAVVDPEPGVEGEDYVPHVTIGRTTDETVLTTVTARDLDPVEWEVTSLVFYDAAAGTEHGRIDLDR